MQQLKRGSRLAIGVVGVQAERSGGVGEVRGAHGDADVEDAAVVRLAHGSEEADDLLDKA